MEHVGDQGSTHFRCVQLVMLNLVRGEPTPKKPKYKNQLTCVGLPSVNKLYEAFYYINAKHPLFCVNISATNIVCLTVMTHLIQFEFILWVTIYIKFIK